MRKWILLLVSLCISGQFARAQSTAVADMGLQAYHDYHGGDIDHIDLDTGSLNVTIPLVSYPQRGNSLKLDFNLVFNSGYNSFYCTFNPDWTWSYNPNEGAGSEYVYGLNANYECGAFSADWFSPLRTPDLTLLPMGGKTSGLVDAQDMGGMMQDVETSQTEPIMASNPNPSLNLQPQVDLYGNFYYTWLTSDGGTHNSVLTNNGFITTDGSNIQSNYVLLDSSNTPSIVEATAGNVATTLTYSCTWGCSLPAPSLRGTDSLWEAPFGGNILGSKDGIIYFGPDNAISSGPIRMDADGNYISATTTNITTSDGITRTVSALVDTVGRIIPYPIYVTSSTYQSSCPNPNATWGVAEWYLPGYSKPFLFCYATVTTSNTLTDSDYFYFLNYPVKTGWQTYATGSEELVESVVLPNGQSWTFGFNESIELAPGYNFNFGDLTHITFPTGGTIDYVYGPSFGGQGCIPFNEVCASSSAPYEINIAGAVTSRTVTDNGGAHTWNYIYGPAGAMWTTTVVDPACNTTVQQLTPGSANPQRVTQYYQGLTSAAASALGSSACSSSSLTLLKTDTRTYDSRYSVGLVGATAITSFPSHLTSETITDNQSGYATTTNFQYTPNISFVQPNQLLQQTAGANPFPVLASNEKVIGTQVYDWTASTTGTGSLLKNVQDSYLVDSYDNPTSPYTYLGLFDLKTSETVTGNTGESITTYAYDGSARAPSGISTGSNQYTSALFGAIGTYGVYGHPTSVTKVLNVTAGTGGTGPTSITSYYNTGEVYQTKDPKGNATTYVDTACNYSLPFTVTNALNQTTTDTYRCDTGQKTAVTDPNGQSTLYTTSADPLNRLTLTTYPDGGSTSIQYNDFSQIGATVTQAINNSASKSTQYIVDALGRDQETILLTDPSGPVYTQTAYDALGHVQSVTNPFRTTSDPTYGVTTYAYDALNRKTSQTNPDNHSQQWCYDGVATNNQTNCNPHITSAGIGSSEWVDFMDENGNDWQRSSDALGRLKGVIEPSSGSAAPPSMETDYSYDALNNLLSVVQYGGSYGTSGYRSRSFTYDSISRLLCAANPENTAAGASCPSTSSSNWTYVAGTVGYSYSASGAFCAGDVSLPCSRTDARGVTTTYGYDGLNRLTSKSYSDSSTPTSCYQYDSSSIPNGIGRLSSSWTQAGACSTSSAFWTKLSIVGYDAMGRTASEQQCTPSNCTNGTPYTPTYTYDLAGDLASYTNGITTTPTVGPLPLLFNISYDSAGRLSALSSNWNSTNYTTSLFPATLFSTQTASSLPCGNSTTSAPYAPFGGLQNALLGTGLALNQGYDKRLRTICENDTGTGATATSPGFAAVTITGAEQHNP